LQAGAGLVPGAESLLKVSISGIRGEAVGV